MEAIMTTTKKGTLLDALMCHNGLGVSGNRRSIQAGVVTLNGEVEKLPGTTVTAGDVIRIGRHTEFRIV